MNTNIKLNEKIAILAAINPSSINAGTVVSAWVPAANFHSISAQIQTGAMTATGTLDAKLRQATDAAGTGAKDVPGKAITQILAASGSNVQASIELRAEDLDVANAFAFVALSLTIGAAASIVGAQLLGANARYAPASALNATSVVQVV
ncbi:hypothetical protein [Glaciimonas sp. PCH181]|uniref:hypothetical protein n=1 Tax=Glaciimonas sp. PCH181 TaxID=2133943 RepID=UPI000D344F48|nr:hypothetical protein [Glaciimonas sp. PCH181]PUA17269.1 hypothetical protein C7W93_15160 [Glaciimonas sp. PCH181]